MTKNICLILVLVSSNSAFALDKLTENLRSVCSAPSNHSKYWNIKARGGLQANGFISLIAAGVNGEARFTKEEWDGVQQVLRSAQAGDNDSYRKCVKDLAPYFSNKFPTPTPTQKSRDKTKHNPIYSTKQTTHTTNTSQKITPEENTQIKIDKIDAQQVQIIKEVDGDVINNNTFGK